MGSEQATAGSIGWKQTFVERVRESMVVLCLVTAIFVTLVLSSWRSEDPGLFEITSGEVPVANLGGQWGAWFADVLLFSAGLGGWLVPLLLLGAARYCARGRPMRLNVWLGPLIVIKGLGGIFVVVCLAALASMHVPQGWLGYPASAGGVLGEAFGALAESRLGRVGGTFVLVGFSLLGLTILTEFSWSDLLHRCGRAVRVALHKGRSWRVGRNGQKTGRCAGQDDPAGVGQGHKARRMPRITLNETPAGLSGPQAPIHSPDRTPAAGVLHAPTARKPYSGPAGAAKGQLDGDNRPGKDLLDPAISQPEAGYSQAELDSLSGLLEQRLLEFGVKVQVVEVNPGPVVTSFEIEPAPGIKVSKITALSKDLARSLSVESVRVVEVIPGKSYVGLEIPNRRRAMVRFSEVVNSRQFAEMKSPLCLALGHDISGQPVSVDLAAMPHLLVAGTTGSGKSVGVNAMILSMLYKSSPDDVRMIMVDPKMLELSVYDGIPHLLSPVVTDMKEAANALRWCVAEMERRYKLMASQGVRNIKGFNDKLAEAEQSGEPLVNPFADDDIPELLQHMPYIVVVVDEFADMMMMVGKKVEELIARLAQKARAAGIHLVLATQRPSVDVITGLIKANIPVRIGYQVSSRIDSRTILDQGGAESLLGNGDMLFLGKGAIHPRRVHGAFVSDEEVHRVVAALKSLGEPKYEAAVTQTAEGGENLSIPGLEPAEDAEQDPLYDQAVAFVVESRRASTSAVQRKLKIGYNRAARMIESMELAGVVSEMNSNGSREVLVPDRNGE